jgi:hypothetical protein
VELGVELQAIVQHAWWDVSTGTDPNSYGLGLALRLRGTGELDETDTLAESRLYVRVMASRADAEAVARATMPPASTAGRAITVLVGLGASFGSGTPAYVSKFRMRPLELRPVL